VRRTLNRTDFLAACKASDTRNKSLEEIRDRGADIILAVFRMLKNSLVHATDNRAVQLTVKETHAIIGELAKAVGSQISVTYVEDTIFVCGQLLRASRSIYESAMEVGKLFAICGVSEISFAPEMTEQDLLQLCEAFAISARDPARRAHLLQAKLTSVVVRAVDSSLQSQVEDDHDDDAAPMEHSLRAYASALVVMRQFFDKVGRGKAVLPHRIKRISQRLVAIADGNESCLLSMLTLANAHRDEAGRAVQSAILAIVVARKLTSDRIVLSQLGMAALMADIGRVRLAGTAGNDGYVLLNDDAERSVPALASALCIATGGVNVQNAVRTVTTFEATQLERQALLGPVYKRQMAPLIQSKILHAVRALLELLAPRDTTVRPVTPLDALAQVSRLGTVDEMVFKLLVQALGVLPTGTVVEFETGEWGIVVGPSENRGAIARPRIKVITDRAGEVFAKPKEIDLGQSGAGRRFPKIVGIIEPSRARFNVTAVLLEGSATKSQLSTGARAGTPS
jgi:hypothetical protein